jgi:hypothetical protein
MKITVSAFIGSGRFTNIEFRFKVGGSIRFVSSSQWNLLAGSEESWTSLERFFNELVLATHKEGFQKLSSMWEKEISQFDSEYFATYLYDAMKWLQLINSFSSDEDPIL